MRIVKLLFKTNKNSWITSDLLNIIKTKEKLYKKYIKYPGDLYYSTAYKSTVKFLKNKIRTVKNDFHLKSFNECTTSSGMLLIIY